MPVLAYCMLSPEEQVALPSLGVRGANVESLTESGIRCLFSRLDLSGRALQKQDALRFHQVVTAVFEQAAVAPFRFPTLLEEAGLRGFLRENATAYLGALSRLREMVQMELRIKPNSSAAVVPESGTAYLRARQKTAGAVASLAAAARSAAAELAREWRERPTAQGLRCYALVRREEREEFRHRMQSLQIGETVSIAVTGPWPATEFLGALSPAELRDPQRATP